MVRGSFQAPKRCFRRPLRLNSSSAASPVEALSALCTSSYFLICSAVTQTKGGQCSVLLIFWGGAGHWLKPAFIPSCGSAVDKPCSETEDARVCSAIEGLLSS